MPRKAELVGRRFGRLVVLIEDGRDHIGAVMWRCLTSGARRDMLLELAN